MKRPVEVRFYDGVLAEAQRAWIVSDQQHGIALKLSEETLKQVSEADFYFSYPDMAYIGGVGDVNQLSNCLKIAGLNF